MRGLLRPRVAIALATVVLLAGCSTADPPRDAAGGQSPAVTSEPTAGAEPGQTTSPSSPVSVLGLAAQTHRGDRLRRGAVRERTAAYISYDVTYRSRSTTARGEESYTISGVLNVPTGKGPFPAVVLAHGYIDPDVYVRGQGMTRERGYLATRGYIALHVDYRNHAESDADPYYERRMRLGYSADVNNAVRALRAAATLPVADEQIYLFGRSMGGGVTLKSLIAEPGLVAGAAIWAGVSSIEAENYHRFVSRNPDSDLARSNSGPDVNPELWRVNSARPYFDRIVAPVLVVHGRNDETCPVRWARDTSAALSKAGVRSRLQLYDDGHAFGPAFDIAMDRTIRFFDSI